MRERTLILSVLIAAAGAGCQRAAPQPLRWPSRPGASEPFPAALALRLGTARAARLGSETVVSGRLTAAGFPVAGGWVKNVRDASGSLVYASGLDLEPLPPRIRSKAAALAPRRDEALKEVRRAWPPFARARWTHGPELELHPPRDRRGWRVLWALGYLDPESGAFKRILADPRGRVVSVEDAGTGFVDAPATVFPKGPRASRLEDVVLRGLFDGTKLASAAARVTCTDEPSLDRWPVGDRSFRFAPEDSRFDIVQAYFYVDRAQAWFREHAGFAMPSGLTLDLYAGGLEHPRNTACYYYGIIRLGAGDGKTYRDLMRDPSVVMHEVSHAVIEAIAHLPTQEEGGSLNEAFADYFAASILESPRMAEVSYVPGPYKRTLENGLRYPDRDGGLYHDSLIVSGTLWEIREALGPARGLELALKVLARLSAESGLKDFRSACAYALQGGFSPDEAERVLGVLKAKGWEG